MSVYYDHLKESEPYYRLFIGQLRSNGVEIIFECKSGDLMSVCSKLYRIYELWRYGDEVEIKGYNGRYDFVSLYLNSCDEFFNSYGRKMYAASIDNLFSGIRMKNARRKYGYKHSEYRK
jgi:hypothetical protein